MMDNNTGFHINIWIILLVIMLCQIQSCMGQRDVVTHLREIKQELRK